mmetsp:Transcript_6104/g.18110  ORF Transcript_6104/g.18110 Transcript_6104/m.18110 type:complete len:247 (-) Transcript_6104:213-953(-)
MGAGPEDAGHRGTVVSPSAGRLSDDDAGNAYSSMTVEDSGDAELQLWRWRWMGRIMEWRVPCGIVYIGPHWYCSIIMLSFILGVGSFYCNSAVQSGPWQLLGGLAVTLLSTWTFLRCALANPGVLKAKSPGAAEEGAEGDVLVTGDAPAVPSVQRRNLGAGRRCNTCNLTQPRGCSHCNFCQVCIEGFDHHCPWMGKCIGKNNLCAFYTFIAVSMSSLGYIFVFTIMASTPFPPAGIDDAPASPAR